MGKRWKQWQTLCFGVPKSLQMVIAAMKLKDACSLERSYDQPRQHIKKQKHYFADKCQYSQSYGFSSSHVWMWELEYKESWVPKNWCFWTVVLEKTLESPLDCKEIQPVNSKGNQSWIAIGRTDAEAETPILWSTNTKNWLTVILFFVCVVNINEPSYQWDPMWALSFKRISLMGWML